MDEMESITKGDIEEIKKASNLIIPVDTGFVVHDILFAPRMISRNPVNQYQYSLSEADYHKYLNIINEAGKSYERNPKGLQKVEEEGIRDNILAVLNSHYPGEATGETFNKTGKTDIRIRNSKNEIFIAECKIWRGKESFLKAIDQLIGYIGWRDTKNALIIFCKNKNLSSVFTQIRDEIMNHEQYVKKLNEVDSAYIEYLFRQKDNPEMFLHLTVIIIHIYSNE